MMGGWFMAGVGALIVIMLFGPIGLFMWGHRRPPEGGTWEDAHRRHVHRRMNDEYAARLPEGLPSAVNAGYAALQMGRTKDES